MYSVLDILAEQRILDALQRGELDNLPGAGQAIVIDEFPLVAPEQRMLNKILHNAGCTPAEVVLRREIFFLRQSIAALPPGERRQSLQRELVLQCLKLQQRG